MPKSFKSLDHVCYLEIKLIAVSCLIQKPPKKICKKAEYLVTSGDLFPDLKLSSVQKLYFLEVSKYIWKLTSLLGSKLHPGFVYLVLEDINCFTRASNDVMIC